VLFSLGEGIKKKAAVCLVPEERGEKEKKKETGGFHKGGEKERRGKGARHFRTEGRERGTVLPLAGKT